MEKETYLVRVVDWLEGCPKVQDLFLGDVDAPLDCAKTGIIGCLVIGRSEADALKSKLANRFHTGARSSPPVWKVEQVQVKTKHFTHFGLLYLEAQLYANTEGFLHYRQYSEYLPETLQTETERFIHRS